VIAIKQLLTAFAVALLGGTLLSAGPAPQGSAPPRRPVDVATLGPQVGGRAPDFNLIDQNGKSWTLPSIMGPKGAMLVFFRSADW
jgi:cytochrome oxidase Cu insertion factor (SCO1/SenC/PrrC family)